MKTFFLLFFALALGAWAQSVAGVPSSSAAPGAGGASVSPGQTINAKSSGAKGDARYVSDGAMTLGSPNLSSATAAFTSSDGGKAVTVAGGGAAGADLITTISSVSTGTVAVLGASSSANLTGKDATIATDDTAAVQGAINAVMGQGGGEVFFPASSYLILGQLTFPNNGATVPLQASIRLIGVGAWTPGAGTLAGLAPYGTSVLDLRYVGTPAKFDTRGAGQMEIAWLTSTDNGIDSTAFFQTTNTVVQVHDTAWLSNIHKTRLTGALFPDQDAIVLGGVGVTAPPWVSADACGGPLCSFQGYQSTVQRNYFDHVRRAVYLRLAANAVAIRDNYAIFNCGADSTAGAFEIDGGDPGDGLNNIIENNNIETAHYVYPVLVTHGRNSVIAYNDFEDPSDYLGHSDLVAYVRFVSSDSYPNLVILTTAPVYGSVVSVSDATAGPYNTVLQATSGGFAITPSIKLLASTAYITGSGGVYVQTNGGTKSFYFDTAGNFTAPTAITATGGYFKAPVGSHIYMQSNGGSYTLDLSSNGSLTMPGTAIVTAGGSATTIVCWKSDGKTLGYATMSAGNISACN